MSCRVCFCTKGTFISPCACKGSLLYVHDHCLQKSQEFALRSNNPIYASTCAVCKSAYNLDESSLLYLWLRRYYFAFEAYVNYCRLVYLQYYLLFCVQFPQLMVYLWKKSACTFFFFLSIVFIVPFQGKCIHHYINFSSLIAYSCLSYCKHNVAFVLKY